MTWHSVFHTVEGLVAVGTILLALGTLGVALLTRSTAKATKRLATETRNLVEKTGELARVSAEEVEMSRRALQAEVKPMITDWPQDNRQVIYKQYPEERVITVPAVNAAAPGALITRVTMHWSEQGRETSYIGYPSVLALMAGGATEATFVFGPGEYGRLDEGVDTPGKFSVEIDVHRCDRGTEGGHPFRHLRGGGREGAGAVSLGGLRVVVPTRRGGRAIRDGAAGQPLRPVEDRGRKSGPTAWLSRSR